MIAKEKAVVTGEYNDGIICQPAFVQKIKQKPDIVIL